MEVIKKINRVREIISEKRKKNIKIGFVPTMGALHRGHVSLIEESVKECGFTVVSIFVNPIQFVQGEDFDKYPRVIEKDLDICKKAKADLVFVPDAEDILGKNLLAFVDIDKLQDNLCGLSRPGHFRGVCTIVAKLFNIVNPDRSYFGKKDIQQLIIIEKLAEDLNFNVKIVPCPIVRDSDGLAHSSRNTYLNEKERKDCTAIFKSLKDASERILNGEKNSKIIIDNIKSGIAQINYAKIDYVKIVNRKMIDVDVINNGDIVACAVYFGKTRLIDNFIAGEKL